MMRRWVVPGEGFEPPTFGLQNRCTTTVLTRLITSPRAKTLGNPSVANPWALYRIPPGSSRCSRFGGFVVPQSSHAGDPGSGDGQLSRQADDGNGCWVPKRRTGVTIHRLMSGAAWSSSLRAGGEPPLRSGGAQWAVGLFFASCLRRGSSDAARAPHMFQTLARIEYAAVTT